MAQMFETIKRSELLYRTTAAGGPLRDLGADGGPRGGAHARDGSVTAWVGRRDGTAWIADELAGDDPAALGAELARRLLSVGAGELLGA